MKTQVQPLVQSVKDIPQSADETISSLLLTVWTETTTTQTAEIRVGQTCVTSEQRSLQTHSKGKQSMPDSEVVTKYMHKKSITEGFHLHWRVEVEGRKDSQPCPS